MQDTLEDLLHNIRRTDIDEDRPAGKMSNIRNVIFRHSVFYTESEEWQNQYDAMHDLDEVLENREMDLDERVDRIFGVMSECDPDIPVADES